MPVTDLQASRDVVAAILGWTEGTYRPNLGTDLRYASAVSTGRSGLSFGIIESDVGERVQ